MQQEYQQQFTLSNDNWAIGLSPWILADGNYWNGNFHGFYQTQSALFALELNPRSIESASSQEKQAIHQNDINYTVTGEVVFTWEHGWIIDFGLLAYIYHRSKPPYLPERHSFVTIDTYLGIDHFAYYLFLHTVPGMPPLLYHWYVQGIIREIYPLVRRTGDDGRDFFIPDHTKSRYIERSDTRYTDSFAVADKAVFPDSEKTSDHFILICQLLSSARQYPVIKPK